jgi:hypothetical protein
MSQRDRVLDPSAPADRGRESTFLTGIEFLTGRNPNLGSFLLVVGLVTCVFIALFQFTLPAPISHLLTAGVIFVTVLSAVFAAVLDRLGHFGRYPVAPTESSDRQPATKPWIPSTQPSVPLPPVVDFDAELQAYADMYDGVLPAAFGPFIEDYLRLQTNTRNRATIASDLRADLNPIGVLFEAGTAGDRIYEEMSERLFRYISAANTHLRIDRVTFYDSAGTATPIGDLENQSGRVELDITNEGDQAEVEAVVELLDTDGSVIASRTCGVGLLAPGATASVDTDVFVPEATERANTTVRVADRGQPVSGA